MNGLPPIDREDARSPEAGGLAALYPFRSRFLAVGRGPGAPSGHRLHYVDEGSGPVVVCLHGNPTWGFQFRRLIADLRGDFRVIVPDQIGCGLSDKPADILFGAVDRIAHLEELFAHLGIGRFSLVMHDWGGPIGTGLAVRRPDDVERLVYLNTMLAETALLPPMIRMAASPRVGRWLTQHSRWFLKLLVSQGVARGLSADVREGYLHPYPTRASRTAIWGFVRDIPFKASHPTHAVMEEMVSRLPLLAEKPVKLVWGMRDPCFHPEILRHVAARFRAPEVVRIADASHLVIEDAPQRVVAEVGMFLRAAAAESAPAPALDRPDAAGGPTVAVSAAADQAEPRLASGGLYAALQSAAAAAPWVAAVTRASFPRWSRAPKYDAINFAALSARIHAYEHGLASSGLRAAERVIMLVSPGADFLALSYAVMGRGAVPVFIDPGMGIDAVLACMREAEPSGFIGVPKAHLLRLKAAGLFRSLRFCVVASRFPMFGATRVRDLLRPSSEPPAPIARQADDAALVAFTSGATGTPKGVVFTNRMLTEQLAVFRSQFGFRGGEQDLPLLPVFSLFTAALGVGSIFPPLNPSRPLSLVPGRIVRVMQDLGNETCFGSPTLWSKLAEYCRQTGTSLPKLRRVFMAGAPVSQATIDLVAAACPQAQSFTPYGATEALPVTIAAASELRQQTRVKALSGEQGAPVGRAIDGVTLRIVRPVEGAGPKTLLDCAEREIGEIVVSGATVSREYLRRPEATAAGKVVEGDRVWHRMGDMGYLDATGQLYFCGRRVHMVVTPTRVFHSVPIENVFNSHPAVSRSALVGVDGGAALVVEPTGEHWPLAAGARRRLAEELGALAAADPVTAAIRRFYFHPSFPVDARHNAKIFRDKLAVWAATQAPVDLDPVFPGSAGIA
jgi:acyl-CoA synthetase (AMP-forming)/AMP-acid ligase II/pimeloyl-ACP methyl ester carboxylesterase